MRREICAGLPRWLSTFLLLFVLAVPLHAQQVLYILPHYFGANNYLYFDDLANMGMDITLVGLTETVDVCPWAGQRLASDLDVDMLISEITDVTAYDVVFIGTASTYYGPPFSALRNDETTLQLLQTAHANGIPIAAWCTGVRLLAAADVLDGCEVSGSDNYQDEYEAAGATFVGEGCPPVVSNNIITATRNMYQHLQNAEIIADVIERNLFDETQGGGQ
jgi:putative intracellular protease/amidase